MDHSNPVVLIGDISLVTGWAIMLTFVVRYALFSPWRSEPAGVALMGFMVTAVSILTMGMVLLTFGVFPMYTSLRMILYLALPIAAGRFLVVLVKAQRKQAAEDAEEKRSSASASD